MAKPTVILRPATQDDEPMLRRLLLDPEFLGPDWSGFASEAAFLRRLGESNLLGTDDGLLVVEVDGAAVGEVSWRAVRYGGAPSVWNIGVALAPESRGSGWGSVAQRLLVDYLFSTTTVERIEAHARVDNPAECRALERAGFTREGVLRRAQFKSGSWRDVAIYSVLRSEQ